MPKAKQVTLHGIAYPSLREACRRLGVGYSTASTRLSRGLSLEEALDPDGRWPYSIEGPDGRAYWSVSRMCEELGVPRSTYYCRKGRGMDDADALGFE